MKLNQFPVDDISNELKAQYPNAESLILSKSLRNNIEKGKIDTVVTAVIGFKNGIKPDKQKIENWLKARTKNDKLILFYENI
jgi:hypothetical protein